MSDVMHYVPVTLPGKAAERRILEGDCLALEKGHDRIIVAKVWSRALPAARATPEMVTVVSELLSRPALDDAWADPRAHLDVVAWVKNIAYTKNVWIDWDLYDAAGRQLSSQTLDLTYVAPAGGGGDLFQLKTYVPPDNSGARGCDIASIAYGLYYAVNDEVFTDGLLHVLTFGSPANAEGRGPSLWDHGLPPARRTTPER